MLSFSTNQITMFFPYSDSGFLICYFHTNFGFFYDISCLRFTERVEIHHFVVDVFNRETEDLDAHTSNIRRRNFSYHRSKCVPVCKNDEK